MASAAAPGEPLPVWAARPQKKSRKRPNGRPKYSRSCSCDSLASVESMEFRSDPGGYYDLQIKILDPNSALRVLWDVVSILLVIYDMVIIPLQVFDIPREGWIIVLEWTSRIFWTSDIVLNFFTGRLQPDGFIEMSPGKIARKYLTTWFGVDLFVAACDWCELAESSLSWFGMMRVTKVARTFRILRMLRLNRLERTTVIGRVKSEQLIIMFGILNNLAFIVGLGHIIACLWYGVSERQRGQRLNTWLEVSGIHEADLSMKYATSLHWSLLQFAGGTDEIVPQNVGERVYAIGAFLLSFVMATVFVGRLTSSITQLHMLSRKDIERFQVLKRYLLKNAISATLSVRVMHNAQHALSEAQRFMEESQVELLGMVSEPLRTELHFELYSPVLAVHPFFRAFIEACPQVMKKVCHKALSLLVVSNGDVLYMLGEVPTPPRMFIVCSGELSYEYNSGAMAYIEAGQWISEATLWTNQWTHQGNLKAVSDCRLCVLDATKFAELTEAYDHDFDIRSYARTFVNSMNNGVIDASDLPFYEDAEDIMEVIDRLTPSKEGGVPMRNEEANKTWHRQGSTTSVASSGADSCSEVDTSCGTPKRSVLMVTPGANSEEAKKNAWW
mmetsp:Transcript_49829/g.119971  ORF Transcript_49829/g.119971 Transcript_49829/m.119971 type:complete len:614 (+) Transcript_49829:3-1844(+)